MGWVEKGVLVLVGFIRRIPAPHPSGCPWQFKIAPGDFVFGASLRLTLRAAFGSSKMLLHFCEPQWVKSNTALGHKKTLTDFVSEGLFMAERVGFEPTKGY
ncbi:MAG: hypothetical protein AAF197_04145 [Pseudomonadota bacterium]